MAPDLNRNWMWAFWALVAGATIGLVATNTEPIVAALVAAVTIAFGLGRARASRAATRRGSSVAVAHLSHELRTPLTSVLGLMDVLEDQTVPLEPGEMEELIGLAHGEAMHMSHVVSNLIASTRVDRGLLEPDPEPLDPISLVEQALQRMPTVEKRTYVSRQAAMPAYADPALVLQILLNLFQNIERYAPDGEVAIGCAIEQDEVVLSISDDGPGISRSTVFKVGKSRVGLGLGLSLSRTLARLMGGDLRIAKPRRKGATLQLLLPHSTQIPSSSDPVPRVADRSVALSPRARLLVDMTDALSDRSLDRVVMGLHKLCVEMLGARSAILAIPTSSGSFERVGSFGGTHEAPLERRLLHATMAAAQPMICSDLAAEGHQTMAMELDSDAALSIPVLDDEVPVGVFLIGWATPQDLPGEQGRVVAAALAQLAAFAIDRSALVEDAAFERELRSSVMESLPLAISVFAGDPPRVIDWNRREREMLGILDDSMRPSDLATSQELFDVRFADGTPLNVDTAPVTEAIRTGRSTGPFLLRIRRSDGSETTTRTYCAPFFDHVGNVIGAVVTSEELDAAASSNAIADPERRTA